MQDGVEFLDKGTSKEVKLLVHNHFRSNTLLNMTIELQKCWEECLVQQIELPMEKVHVTQYTCNENPISKGVAPYCK